MKKEEKINENISKVYDFMITVLTMMMVFGAFSTFAATRSSFDQGNCCTVTISNKLMNQKKYKTATVKFKTHDLLNTNRNTGGKVYISMYDEYGRHIWSGVKKGGNTLKFGNDHRMYKVYVKVYNNPNQKSNNFINRGKCAYWSFSNAKNCSIR